MADDLRPNELRISLHGENITLEDIAKTLGAFDDLTREVAREVTGDPDAVRWLVADMRFICDGCGRTRPAEHDDWIYVDGDDLCPDCAVTKSVQTEDS